MEKNPIGRDAAVVSAMCFIAGAVLAWAFTSDPNGIHNASIEWPAWFQAIGSILALVVAIVVPWRLALQARNDLRAREHRDRYDRELREARDRDERRMDRAMRARSYAFVLLPHIDEAQGYLLAAKRRWDKSPFADDDIMELLTIPDGISAMLLEMHEVSDAGNEVRAIVQGIRDLRKQVAYFSSYHRNGGDHYDSENRYQGPMQDHDDVDQTFDRVITTVARARHSLAEIVAGRE